MAYPTIISKIKDRMLRKKLAQLWNMRQVIDKTKPRKPIRNRIAHKYSDLMDDYKDLIKTYNRSLQIQKTAFDVIIASIADLVMTREELIKALKEAEFKQAPVVIIDGIDVTAIAKRREKDAEYQREIANMIKYARKKSLHLLEVAINPKSETLNPIEINPKSETLNP